MAKIATQIGRGEFGRRVPVTSRDEVGELATVMNVKRDYERYANVWDALEPNPGMRECLKLRSVIMSELTTLIEREKWTRAQAAKALGVTQPRISNLAHGNINVFSLDLLAKIAAAAGLRVTMKLKKAA